MLSVATDARAQDGLRLDLDELVREGARRMLAAGLEAEVDETPKPDVVRWLQRWRGQVAVVAGFGIAMAEVEMVEGTVVLEPIES